MSKCVLVDSTIIAGRPITYKLSKDKKGLLCYYKPKSFYHIHSDELTPREKEIHKQLLKNIKGDNRA